MRAAEAAAMAAGVSSAALMEAAGVSVADIARRAWDRRPAVVLCGPGNNGGDGFVVARRLAEAGWTVRLALMGEKGALKGDAKLMAGLYEGEVAPLAVKILDGAGLIIDAIFGTGLSRAVEGDALTMINAVNAHPAPVLSIDIPSGVNADTGAVMSAAVRAARTVTFFHKKPGHILFPGRGFCGAVDVADIGIEPAALKDVRVDTFENHPGLWGPHFHRPSYQTHKYHRGSVFVVSGGALNTGAARLAARGALRIGAGLVTILSPKDAAAAHAAHLTAIMLRLADTGADIAGAFRGGDKYPETAIIGPGAGTGAGAGERTREKTIAILKSNAGAVLDADALTSFADTPDELFGALRKEDVLTPHDGEFDRLFADGASEADDKPGRARAASQRAGAIIVLKGADTVIAAPDGRIAININAPPDLATAGSGDVLAGFIAGLKAQAMPGFEAACAGVWFHGACGQTAGPGLIAEDLPEAVPAVLRSLFSPPEKNAAAPSGVPQA